MEKQEKMTCDDCSFIDAVQVLGQDTQIGCLIREDTIKIAKEQTDDGNYILDGLCQYKRDKEWEHSDKKIERQIDLAKEEAKITFDISFLTNNEAWTEEQFEHVREFAYLPRVSRAFYSDGNEYMKSLESGCATKEWESKVLSLDPETDWRIIQGRSSVGTFFGCFADVRVLPKNFLYWLDHQINANGLRFAIASSDEDVLISRNFFRKAQFSVKDMIDVGTIGKHWLQLSNLIYACKQKNNWNSENNTWI